MHALLPHFPHTCTHSLTPHTTHHTHIYITHAHSDHFLAGGYGVWFSDYVAGSPLNAHCQIFPECSDLRFLWVPPVIRSSDPRTQMRTHIFHISFSMSFFIFRLLVNMLFGLIMVPVIFMIWYFCYYWIIWYSKHNHLHYIIFFTSFKIMTNFAFHTASAYLFITHTLRGSMLRDQSSLRNYLYSSYVSVFFF